MISAIATMPERPSPENPNVARTFRGPFAVLTVLFFPWGFVTVFNNILIPRFKEAFTLNRFQLMLVQFAFVGADFLGSLSYFPVEVHEKTGQAGKFPPVFEPTPCFAVPPFAENP